MLMVTKFFNKLSQSLKVITKKTELLNCSHSLIDCLKLNKGIDNWKLKLLKKLTVIFIKKYLNLFLKYKHNAILNIKKLKH